MNQSNSQSNYLNIGYNKNAPGGNLQTHRYSLEKLKEFETKLMQQSAGNSTKTGNLLNSDKTKGPECSFTAASDAAIYGLSKTVLNSQILREGRATAETFESNGTTGNAFASRDHHTTKNVMDLKHESGSRLALRGGNSSADQSARGSKKLVQVGNRNVNRGTSNHLQSKQTLTQPAIKTDQHIVRSD